MPLLLLLLSVPPPRSSVAQLNWEGRSPDSRFQHPKAPEAPGSSPPSASAASLSSIAPLSTSCSLVSPADNSQQPAARSPHPGPRGPSALLCPPRWHARLSRSALVLAPADARHLSVPPHKVSPAPPKPNLAPSPTTMPVSNEAGVKLEPASMSNSSQTPPATGAAAPGDETCMLHRSPPVPSPFRPCLRARGFGRPGPVVLC